MAGVARPRALRPTRTPARSPRRADRVPPRHYGTSAAAMEDCRPTRRPALARHRARTARRALSPLPKWGRAHDGARDAGRRPSTRWCESGARRTALEDVRAHAAELRAGRLGADGRVATVRPWRELADAMARRCGHGPISGPGGRAVRALWVLRRGGLLRLSGRRSICSARAPPCSASWSSRGGGRARRARTRRRPADRQGRAPGRRPRARCVLHGASTLR
jgi:hypothetical protein